MTIHREGYASLLVVGAALSVLNLVFSAILPFTVFVIFLILSIVIWAFFAQFFRSPSRKLPDCANCVLSPADGTIVAIEKTHESEFFKDERLKIAIYMSAFDVHLNRVPIGGKVVYYQYHPGKYLVAFHPKSSELNERNTIVIETDRGQQLLVRQIAGILARRIRCYVQVGQTIAPGDELGFIKFGSRCDVFLPLTCQPKVNLGQKVKGGETTLAHIS